jgi:hypothetical protein
MAKIDTQRTIVLKGKDKGHHNEGVLDGIVLPGMALQMKTNGNYDVVADAVAESLKRSSLPIVKEDSLQGRDYATAYAVGDVVSFYTPIAGDHLCLLVKTGANLAVGDKLVEEGGGSGKFIEAAGTEARYRAVVLEALGVLGADQLTWCRWL